MTVAGLTQRLFVLAMLRARHLDINRHAFQVGQLAVAERCAHGTRNRDPRRHAVIIVAVANSDSPA